MAKSAIGILKNLRNNILGLFRFIFRIYLTAIPISSGEYDLWRQGMASSGTEIPRSLMRTTLSDTKRLVFMKKHISIKVWKPGTRIRQNPLAAATYQSPEKVLLFYPNSGVVTQSILPRSSYQYYIFTRFAMAVPTAALLAESSSKMLKMRLLTGPNLSQLAPKDRLVALVKILSALSELPEFDGRSVDKENLISRVPVGPVGGIHSSNLLSFLADTQAMSVMKPTKLVPAHTDLNLFNIILDDEGEPRIIDFDFRRIQLLPRWFDALVLIRQCAAEFFMAGELDHELVAFFGDEFESNDRKLKFLGRHREVLFDFASVLLAPKFGTRQNIFPRTWNAAERRILDSRERFLGQILF